MTAYAARTRPGPPEQGRYQVGDTVPDSNGTLWVCAVGGMAGAGAYQDTGYARFVAQGAGLSTTETGFGAVPVAVSATVTAAEYMAGLTHRTVLTLADMPQTVVNGTEYQGTKVYTFPEGRILILGVQATLAQKTTSVLASTLNSGATGAVALGSVTASSTTLSSTAADLAPSTAFTSSTTINVAGTAVSPVLASSAQFDGHTTALAMFLNSAYATTTDVDADATQTWTGTIRIVWVPLGDF